MLFLVLAWIAGHYNRETSPAPGEEWMIRSDSWFGCLHREYLEKLTNYAVEKDKEAFSKALIAGLVSGECIQFKRGERVHIVDRAVFSGLIKVRPQGSLEEYWTHLEAVK